MRKYFGIVLASAALAGTLSACSGDELIEEPHQFPCGQPYRHSGPAKPCANMTFLVPAVGAVLV